MFPVILNPCYMLVYSVVCINKAKPSFKKILCSCDTNFSAYSVSSLGPAPLLWNLPSWTSAHFRLLQRWFFQGLEWSSFATMWSGSP